MKNKILIIAAALICGAAMTGMASDDTLTQDLNANQDTMHPRTPGDLYRANEFTLEGYGFGTLNEHNIDRLSGRRARDNGKVGLGAGAEYFFTRYIGIEAEGFSTSTHHSLVDDAAGSLVLRLPIGETGWAPYAFGGAGHRIDPEVGSFEHGGAGIEYRFNPHLGLFSDGRWVFTDKIQNYGMARLGVRFTF